MSALMQPPQPAPPSEPVAAPPPPPEEEDIAPKVFEPENETIYINNLQEKIKEKELKKSLEAIFKQFGKVLKIVAMSSFRRRGQAWVVFEDTSAAKTALESMQGFPFCGKPMRINYAKSKSDPITKRDGTFVPREKKPLGPRPTPIGTKPNTVAKAPPPSSSAAPADMSTSGEQPAKRSKIVPEIQEDAGVANAILFAQNLPEDTTKEELETLFSTYDGFKEVRLVPSRPGIAFVEFISEMHSPMARAQLDQYEIKPGHRISIIFAKK